MEILTVDDYGILLHRSDVGRAACRIINRSDMRADYSLTTLLRDDSNVLDMRCDLCQWLAELWLSTGAPGLQTIRVNAKNSSEFKSATMREILSAELAKAIIQDEWD